MGAVTGSGDSANGGGSNGATNLNNSTTSAHLNVYKPTFIINNSYQPGEQVKEADGNGKEHAASSAEQQQLHQSYSKSGSTQNAADRERQKGSSKNVRSGGGERERVTSSGAAAGSSSQSNGMAVHGQSQKISSKSGIPNQQQQMLLMNVLISQGMDKA